MTCECTTTGTGSPDPKNGCQGCDEDLSAKPFTDLRVAYGMLLGEDDFRVLMANPRGKQMLSAAWLHGSGVVWGMEVGRVADSDQLTVSPGLAIDGRGRMCPLDASWSVDLSAWLEGNVDFDDPDCGIQTVHACLTVEFDCCQTSPVPTLADPCDVTRKHDDFSRVIETAKLSLRRGSCLCLEDPYHCTRVLLGIDEPGCDDHAGDCALEARRAIAELPVGERPAALLAAFRRMSVFDSARRRPASEPGYEPLFPVLLEAAPVVLGCLRIAVKRGEGCPEIDCVDIDPCCRRAVLPTTTIQELLCGLAPGLIGGVGDIDAGGPRIERESVRWNDDRTRLCFSVTAPLNHSTVRDAVRITSLRNHAWVDEDVIGVHFPNECEVEVELADAPAYEIVRVVVKGTGPWPVFGADPPVPLAGLVGGPPCTIDDGRDVALTFTGELPRAAEEA
jgi:hypothetical protein